MMPVSGHFDLFVAIDWSGARGAAHKGLAVAAARPGNAAPQLIAPREGRYWSRAGVLDYLRAEAAQGQRLIAGIDCSFSLPHDVTGGFFPASASSPEDAAGLWALVEETCAGDEDFYAGKFVEPAAYGDYFMRVGAKGKHFSRALRLTESQCAVQGLGRAVPTFNLIGANQVGLASLAAMRMFHHLKQLAPETVIWPFANPDLGSAPARLVLIEIYTRLFLTLAGAPYRKIRERAELEAALSALGSGTPLVSDKQAGDDKLDDHATDALVSAAGIRALVQRGDPAIWQPRLLDSGLAQREGWTFGVR
jgi:hypothetical protein